MLTLGNAHFLNEECLSFSGTTLEVGEVWGKEGHGECRLS